MVLKIFGNCEPAPHAAIPNMFFDLNNQPYEFDTTNKNILYDINASTGFSYDNFDHNVKSKIKLLLHIWDNKENFTHYALNDLKLKEHLKGNFYFLIKQENPELQQEYENLLYVDFIFNFSKSYYLKYPFKDETIKWSHRQESDFFLPEISLAENKNKIFVAINRVRRKTDERDHYRFKLVLDLYKYRHLGHRGAATLNKSLYLIPHGDVPDCKSIDELLSYKIRRHYWRTWSPIHYEYLRDTFIHIYAETIEFGDDYFISEKTYDPLIRGHFILPFSNCGFIKRLKSKGFRFPDFINYEYDEIKNDDARYEKYKDEMSRLMNISIDEWRQHWQNNMDLLKHNRQVMIDTPYDRIDLYKLL